MFTLNCKGQLLNLEQPVVMGILNATPDSFYTGHLHKGLDGIMLQAIKMIEEGAAIIDVGGQSTRPGSERISAAEEIERVLPVIEGLQKNHPHTILSIDTYDSKVAAAAVQAGAHIVNDISGGMMDANMIATVASFKNVPYICMHMKGRPENMQLHAQYEDVVKEVLDFFVQKQEACRVAGIQDVIIDPGFGFAKTAEHNLGLLRNLAVLEILERPILVGLSRKATVYKTLGITAAEALNGTTVLNTIALMNGANILRVHDVKEAREAVQLVAAYNEAVA
ncbi:MAG: dihydropteroate synthase [Chitinophagaceae bacterium]|nr:MAG: dihydropteroate synthase [Chitinophagaceae bacterium]